MSSPVLATKISIPLRRAQVVHRVRLLKRLDESLQCPLTLVSAPAGFGKSTLLAEWASGFAQKSPEVPIAWLSLDEDDRDPYRFLASLGAALHPIAPRVTDLLTASTSSFQPQPLLTALTRLVNGLASLHGSCVLILDDFHQVDQRAVDEVMAYLVDHLPPQLHVIIASRQDPALALARLRARHQLLELRAADLRFTSAESAEFLNRSMGLNLSPKDVRVLEKRTEGWAAGLQLAALSLQGREDRAQRIADYAGSHRFVLDYLATTGSALELGDVAVQGSVFRSPDGAIFFVDVHQRVSLGGSCSCFCTGRFQFCDHGPIGLLREHPARYWVAAKALVAARHTSEDNGYARTQKGERRVFGLSRRVGQRGRIFRAVGHCLLLQYLGPWISGRRWIANRS